MRGSNDFTQHSLRIVGLDVRSVLVKLIERAQ
jgi:hypothetical protein